MPNFLRCEVDCHFVGILWTWLFSWIVSMIDKRFYAIWTLFIDLESEFLVLRSSKCNNVQSDLFLQSYLHFSYAALGLDLQVLLRHTLLGMKKWVAHNRSWSIQIGCFLKQTKKFERFRKWNSRYEWWISYQLREWKMYCFGIFHSKFGNPRWVLQTFG